MAKPIRAVWIDAVRGFAILSIIAFHSGFLPFIQISDPLLASWFLPVFLFTGGWLLKNEPFSFSRAFSTIKQMLVPFFIAGIISFAGWFFLRNAYPQHVLYQPVAQEILKWLTGRNAFFNSPLWFLPTYIIASLFMRFIAVWWFRRHKIFQILLSIFFVSIGFLLSHSYHYSIFSYDLILLFIGMMMMGSIARVIRVPKSVDVFAIVLFIVLAISNGYVDMFQRQFGNPFLYIGSAALGTYTMARFIRWKFLERLGQKSMRLMIWHWPIMQWLTYILYTTGTLHTIAVGFTKTSFILSNVGLQLLFCALYTSVSIFCIVSV